MKSRDCLVLYGRLQSLFYVLICRFQVEAGNNMAVAFNCGLLRNSQCYFWRASTSIAYVAATLFMTVALFTFASASLCQDELSLPKGLNSILRYDVLPAVRTGTGSGPPRQLPNLTHITVDEKTGTVFVASSRAVYRFSSELMTFHTCRQISSIFEPEIIDGGSRNISNLGAGFCWLTASKPSVLPVSSRENEVRIFEIDPNSRQLLLCGVENCGLCAVANVDDPNLEFQTLDRNEPASYMGGDQLSKPFVLFPGRAHLSPTSMSKRAEIPSRDLNPVRHRGDQEASIESAGPSVFYVSGATLPMPEILSVRLLSTRGNGSSSSVSPDSNLPPQLRHMRDAKNTRSARLFADTTFPRQFRRVYAFEDDGFAYFLLVHNDTRTREPVTRLARVCLDDSELLSYTEIVLECEHWVR